MVVIIIVQTAQSLRYRSGDYAGNEYRSSRTVSPLGLRRLFGERSQAQTHMLHRRTGAHSALSWGSKYATVPPTHDLSLLYRTPIILPLLSRAKLLTATGRGASSFQK